MIATVSKAFIYLTRGGDELLLLAHPDHPDAGLQVPAGTIRTGETAEAAALRELEEETGLAEVRLVKLLGEALFDMRPFGKPEYHRRFFFHAVLEGAAPERWLHVERDGGPEPIRFELFWWPLSAGLPQLIARHGDLIGQLPGIELHDR